MTQSAASPCDARRRLLAALSAAALTERLIDSPEQLALYATDLAYSAMFKPLAVIKPQTPQETADIVATVYELGLTLEIRAAGMSYSKGYIPQNAETVVVDVSALKRLRYADGCHDVVEVEAGVSWQELDDFLAGTSMRVGLEAPFSGSVSTIGASVRQGLPTDMSAVLAVEIVTYEGRRMATGGLAVDDSYCPAWNGQGPDLTALFVGDCGAFGVMTRLWLRLKPVPSYQRFFSCTLSRPEQFTEILQGLATLPGQYRGFCFDHNRSAAARQHGLLQLGRLAIKVLRSKRGVRSRISSVMQMLRSACVFKQKALNSNSWSAHFILESNVSREVDALVEHLSSIALEQRYALLTTTVAEALSVKPYSLRGILGRHYERWVPVNAIFSLNARERVLPALHDELSRLRAHCGVEDLQTSMLLLSVGRHHFVTEPMFLWRSVLYPIHLQTLPQARQVDGECDWASVDKKVYDARSALISFLGSLGAQHVQLGRIYPHAGRVDAMTQKILQAVKDAVDPKHNVCPGMLGLGDGSEH